MSSGILTLVPTPIDDQSPLETVARERLMQAATVDAATSLFLVEEAKEGRRRWLKAGLPRETVEKFILFNEHTAKELLPQMASLLKSGKNLFLMSDGGLPAFHDPGLELVEAAHSQGSRVTSTPFCNSISLAIALSGLPHFEFHFFGFPPKIEDERKKFWTRVAGTKVTSIVMDTPYRLSKILEEVKTQMPGRFLVLALDLNASSELILRGQASDILTNEKLPHKAEFILLLAPLS